MSVWHGLVHNGTVLCCSVQSTPSLQHVLLYDKSLMKIPLFSSFFLIQSRQSHAFGLRGYCRTYCFSSLQATIFFSIPGSQSLLWTLLLVFSSPVVRACSVHSFTWRNMYFLQSDCIWAFISQIEESEEEWGVPHCLTLRGQHQSIVVAAR